MDKPWAKRNYERRKKEYAYKLRLKRQSESIPRYPGIIKVDTGNGKCYYRPIYLTGGSVKYYKRYAAKKARMCADVPSRSGHKKAFDLWWTLF